MKRLVIGSLLSCMVIGQVTCFFDFYDCLNGKAKQSVSHLLGEKLDNSEWSRGLSGSIGQAAVFSFVTALGHVILYGDQTNPMKFRRSVRIAMVITAAGSLHKGYSMYSAKESLEGSTHWNDYYGFERRSVSEGAGKMMGGGLILAGLLVTARRPAFLVGRFAQARNQFSKSSSKLQDSE